MGSQAPAPRPPRPAVARAPARQAPQPKSYSQVGLRPAGAPPPRPVAHAGRRHRPARLGPGPAAARPVFRGCPAARTAAVPGSGAVLLEPWPPATRSQWPPRVPMRPGPGAHVPARPGPGREELKLGGIQDGTARRPHPRQRTQGSRTPTATPQPTPAYPPTHPPTHRFGPSALGPLRPEAAGFSCPRPSPARRAPAQLVRPDCRRRTPTRGGWAAAAAAAAASGVVGGGGKGPPGAGRRL